MSVYFSFGLKRGNSCYDEGDEDDGADWEAEAQAVVVHVWPLIPDPLYLLL